MNAMDKSSKNIEFYFLGYKKTSKTFIANRLRCHKDIYPSNSLHYAPVIFNNDALRHWVEPSHMAKI